MFTEERIVGQKEFRTSESCSYPLYYFLVIIGFLFFCGFVADLSRGHSFFRDGVSSMGALTQDTRADGSLKSPS